MVTSPGWYAMVFGYYDDERYTEYIEWFYVKDTSGELYVDGTWEINGKEYTFDKYGKCLNP